MDRAGLDDRSEHVGEVDASALAEAPDDLSDLVPLEGAIGVKLAAEHPPAADHVGARGAGHQLPSMVALECLEFFMHGRDPEWIAKSHMN